MADPAWSDPLDYSFSATHGGRWNAPGSHAVLYLSANPDTARMQVERLCAAGPFTIDDLADDAYTLVVATVPAGQRVADAKSADGLAELALPASYPADAQGDILPHSACQPIGRQVKDAGLQGIWCKSACTPDGAGRELAWFPDSGAKATSVGPAISLGGWRYAKKWEEIGYSEQPELAP